jgi:NAD(P)-dependent dehydrogenase (short-subunit alcohol dehydrogenase family)
VSVTLVLGANSFLGESFSKHRIAKNERVVGSFRSAEAIATSELRESELFTDILLNPDEPDLCAINLRQLQSAYPNITGVVCFFGVHKLEPFNVHKKSSLDEIYSANCSSGFLMAKLILQRFKGIESIIFVSSAAALKPEKGLLAYTAAKSALLNGARVLALELARKNVRVNCVSPGWIESPVALRSLDARNLTIDVVRDFHPLGVGRPEDTFGVFDFLLSRESSWITGQNFVVDGGASLC